MDWTARIAELGDSVGDEVLKKDQCVTWNLVSQQPPMAPTRSGGQPSCHLNGTALPLLKILDLSGRSLVQMERATKPVRLCIVSRFFVCPRGGSSLQSYCRQRVFGWPITPNGLCRSLTGLSFVFHGRCLHFCLASPLPSPTTTIHFQRGKLGMIYWCLLFKLWS